MSGCAVEKYCYIDPMPTGGTTVYAGGIMFKKVECDVMEGIVLSCMKPVEIIYLGKTQPENNIRIASRSASNKTVVTEATFSENSKIIDFQDSKIEVRNAGEYWIIFSLSYSGFGCDSVNGVHIKQKR